MVSILDRNKRSKGNNRLISNTSILVKLTDFLLSAIGQYVKTYLEQEEFMRQKVLMFGVNQWVTKVQKKKCIILQKRIEKA